MAKPRNTDTPPTIEDVARFEQILGVLQIMIGVTDSSSLLDYIETAFIAITNERGRIPEDDPYATDAERTAAYGAMSELRLATQGLSAMDLRRISGQLFSVVAGNLGIHYDDPVHSDPEPPPAPERETKRTPPAPPAQPQPASQPEDDSEDADDLDDQESENGQDDEAEDARDTDDSDVDTEREPENRPAAPKAAPPKAAAPRAAAPRTEPTRKPARTGGNGNGSRGRASQQRRDPRGKAPEVDPLTEEQWRVLKLAGVGTLEELVTLTERGLRYALTRRRESVTTDGASYTAADELPEGTTADMLVAEVWTALRAGGGREPSNNVEVPLVVFAERLTDSEEVFSDPIAHFRLDDKNGIRQTIVNILYGKVQTLGQLEEMPEADLREVLGEYFDTHLDMAVSRVTKFLELYGLRRRP